MRGLFRCRDPKRKSKIVEDKITVMQRRLKPENICVDLIVLYCIVCIL